MGKAYPKSILRPLKTEPYPTMTPTQPTMTGSGSSQPPRGPNLKNYPSECGSDLPVDVMARLRASWHAPCHELMHVLFRVPKARRHLNWPAFLAS